MKKFKTKLFISLSMVLTGIVACFAAAYTINIGNQDTYGTLNLGKLLLWRSSGQGTGIEIDGSTYTIKVGTRAGTQATSQIYVSEICGRTGDNCKPVSDLSTGTTISGNTNYICVKQDDNTLNCTVQLATYNSSNFVNYRYCVYSGDKIICNVELPVASTTDVGGIKLYVSNPSGKGNYRVQVDDDGKAFVNVPWEDTHYTGTLTIKGGGKTGIVFYQTGNATLNITGGGGITVTTGNNNTIVISGADTDTHYTGTLTIKGGGKTGIVFYQTGNATLNITGGGGITVTTGNNNTIVISGAGGGGDSLWSESTDKTKIRPTDQTDGVMIGRDGSRQHYILFQGSGTYKTPSPYCGNDKTGGQIIGFSNVLLFSYQSTFECSSQRTTEINQFGLGIHAEASSSYALNVGGDAYMSGITAASASIGSSHYFYNNKAGIKMEPQDDINANLQVNGAIYIKSNGHGSSCTDGTIDYTGGNFYGCRDGERKKFVMFGDCSCPPNTCSCLTS